MRVDDRLVERPAARRAGLDPSFEQFERSALLDKRGSDALTARRLEHSRNDSGCHTASADTEKDHDDEGGGAEGTDDQGGSSTGSGRLPPADERRKVLLARAVLP